MSEIDIIISPIYVDTCIDGTLSIFDHDSRPIADMRDKAHMYMRARRLAACWNVFRGVDTEDIELAATDGGLLGAGQSLAHLKRQNAELLDALSTLLDSLVPVIAGTSEGATLEASAADATAVLVRHLGGPA